MSWGGARLGSQAASIAATRRTCGIARLAVTCGCSAPEPGGIGTASAQDLIGVFTAGDDRPISLVFATNDAHTGRPLLDGEAPSWEVVKREGAHVRTIGGSRCPLRRMSRTAGHERKGLGFRTAVSDALLLAATRVYTRGRFGF